MIFGAALALLSVLPSAAFKWEGRRQSPNIDETRIICRYSKDAQIEPFGARVGDMAPLPLFGASSLDAGEKGLVLQLQNAWIGDYDADSEHILQKAALALAGKTSWIEEKALQFQGRGPRFVLAVVLRMKYLSASGTWPELAQRLPSLQRDFQRRFAPGLEVALLSWEAAGGVDDLIGESVARFPPGCGAMTYVIAPDRRILGASVAPLANRSLDAALREMATGLRGPQP